jgi:Fe-S cluster assembly protein SufD
LLINAFAAEVINQIPIPSLREILLNTVNNLKSLTNE